jgi:hypothetical protein
MRHIQLVQAWGALCAIIRLNFVGQARLRANAKGLPA